MAKTVKQLITHADNESISSTKFWYNIVCTVSTGVVIWYAYLGKLDYMMLVVYMACVGSMKVASDIVRMKTGILQTNTPEPTPQILNESDEIKPNLN